MPRRRKQVKKSKSRRKKYSDSDSSDDSSVDLSSTESDSDLSSSSESESESSTESESEEEEDLSDFDDEDCLRNNKKSIEDDVKELLKDAKLMKYENGIIEELEINTYEAMKNCDEKQLKRIKMSYNDRERLLKSFRSHVESFLEQERERWERKQELKDSIRKKKKGKRGKSKSSKSSKSSKKKTKKGKSSSKSSSKGKSKSKSSKSKSKSSKPKIDPDEALRKLDTGWSGKRQAWADYKQHEARVAELVEFYDEIGKKRTNPEEHARKLILEYPGGIHKLVIALDKKYHHIPYGWEGLLEEAERYRDAEAESSD